MCLKVMEGDKMIESSRTLGISHEADSRNKWQTKTKFLICFLLSFAVAISTLIGVALEGGKTVGVPPRVSVHYDKKYGETGKRNTDDFVVESEKGVVAADERRCSKIGVWALRKGGHAVDAAVATALCLGVVNPMASGIGGGSFMVLHSASTNKTLAFNMRETAPLASSQNMYENNASAKFAGALAMGVPGEIAGLHEAWSKYGRLPWSTLFRPAIKLAKKGFVVAPYLASSLASSEKKIKSDPGLRKVYAPKGKLLKAKDTCYNVMLGRSLEAVAKHGPKAFYNGEIGKKLIKDVKKGGGILTMKDLKSYKVKVTDAVEVNALGYTILGMPPPSSGTLGLALILNILSSYGNMDAAKGDLGLHRLVESLKHMFAIRMNLGDPDFENITQTVSQMLSPQFANQIQKKIFDNTTFPPEYYLSKWSQLQDHGTSHFCIVDGERNVISMTTTINHEFGGGVLSPSTGIVLNNEMDDFSIPTEKSTEKSSNKLPPAPANFIKPNKRPLSSMTPLIVLKDGELVGVLGGSGGIRIIPAVVQVFINHFLLGMSPSAAVHSPRVYHKLIPNVVLYENWTLVNGKHIELSKDKIDFLKGRGHKLEGIVSGEVSPTEGITRGAISQFVTQNSNVNNKKNKVLGGGLLTAVSDPRKDGRPAAV